jgi:hypothetical protein
MRTCLPLQIAMLESSRKCRKYPDFLFSVFDGDCERIGSVIQFALI